MPDFRQRLSSAAGLAPRAGEGRAGERCRVGSHREHSEAELGCLLSLLPVLLHPQLHTSVFLWPHPSAVGGHIPRDLLGKGQDICWGRLGAAVEMIAISQCREVGGRQCSSVI